MPPQINRIATRNRSQIDDAGEPLRQAFDVLLDIGFRLFVARAHYAAPTAFTAWKR
jgi:hypothetical protein